MQEKITTVGAERRVHILTGPTNVGLVEIEDSLLAVDTGLGKETSELILEAAAGLGRHIRYVFNTHGHADHIGGNHFLLKKIEAVVICPAGEAPLVTHTELEPVSLVGGAPFREIQGKFLQAKPSRVDRKAEEGPLPGLPGLEAISLAGHSPDMLGLRCGDVFFSTDAFFPEDLIGKHGLLYAWRPSVWLGTLERLKEVRASFVIPGHGPVEGFELREVIEANAGHIKEISEKILERLADWRTREEVTQEMMSLTGIQDSPSSWALAFGTVSGYLSEMRKNGQISVEVSGGRLLWRRK